MQSCQSGSDDDFDEDESDNPSTIPDFARAWESAPQVVSSVRRPSTLPDPQSYHEVIEPEAIIELDERQKDGSIETIFVVPFGCERCKLLKQACSRTRPACVRCRSNGQNCKVVREGYQRLPGPKVEKPRKQNTREISEESVASHSTQELAARRLVPPRSKRRLSPGSGPVPPRKKAQAKPISQRGEAPSFMVAPPNGECSEASAAGPSVQAVSAVVSVGEHSSLKWMPVDRGERSSRIREHVQSIPSSTLIPRVWTNSLGGLLTVFPELAKSAIDFSWLQSETPILLLDTNYVGGRWIDSITLSIDLLWDFSCLDSELEPVIELDAESSTQFHSCQPALQNTLDCEAETMESRNSYSSPGFGLFPTYMISAPASLPIFGTQMLLSNSTSQDEQDTHQSTLQSYSMDPIQSVTQTDTGSAVCSISPSDPLFPPQNLPSSPRQCLALDGSLTHNKVSQPGFLPRIPLHKPLEVETLLDSHHRHNPLLLWIQHDSELVPCEFPLEYAYSCMGFFFISDLRHAVVQHGVSSTTGLVQGRVCWSITLQWAPGGEDALSDDWGLEPSSGMTTDSAPVEAARNLSHPWWFDPADTLLQTDNATPYRPRDLRMQFFSFIPLDFLAEFHPSESFPRGWFCKSCGMINVQVFFRHQICQSTTCRSSRDNRIPPGKADALSRLRDPHQSSTLIQPTNVIPPVVLSDSITWDDGMQSWIYSVKSGVTLCHIFTGNQQHLQGDATTLLETIQRDVLLHKEDHPSPYFTHSTRLTHPSDGSEAMVPRGTLDCVRIAYYTLCDFVHRYGEMDRPRFGEVRIQAWVNPGSKKGNVFYASKFPVVLHCLGAEVILRFAPRGGYEDATQSTAPDKGKKRAEDDNVTGAPPAEPNAGPSQHPEQDGGNQTPFLLGLEASKVPIVVENVDETIMTMDIVQECPTNDTGDVAKPDSVSNAGPGMEVAREEVVERRGRKKSKITKGKEVSMTLVHGDSVVLYGDDFECQIVRTGTTILVIGLPEET